MSCKVSRSNSERFLSGSRGRVGGDAPLPLGSFQTCLAAHVYPSFIITNNIISYNARSSQIDHYKKTVIIPLLDSLIVQTQDRFSDEDRHARHLLCVVPSLIVNKVLQLDDEVEGMLLWENEETKFSVTPSFVLTHSSDSMTGKYCLMSA